jgi:sugar phosphate isomerase/epimerase
MWNAALSTMWGIKRFDRFGDFFTEGQAAGFAHFEFNHAVNSALLDGVHLNGYHVMSVHEPCPADVSAAELKKRDWLISSADEEKRRHGVQAVRRSVDLARELGASVVIVHPGRVNMDESLEGVLRQMYQDGQAGTPEYEQAAARMKAARAARAAPHVQAVRRSLDELAEQAVRHGVRLGLENRDHYFEIPLLDEMEWLLDQGYGETIGYWHDIGHAEKSQYKGYGSHEAWLERLGDKMIGVHLHDIVGMDDHLPAGQGAMPWDMVARRLPAGILRTCEFNNQLSLRQVAEGLEWLAEKGLVSQV